MDRHLFGKLNTSEITPNIWVGSEICCKEHLEKEFPRRDDLVVLTLEEKPDFTLDTAEHHVFKIGDGEAPSISQLNEGNALIRKAVSEGKRVYVHCLNGHGRSPTFVAAYFISQGMDVESAVKKIKDKRPLIYLNSGQYQSLYDFKKSLG